MNFTPLPGTRAGRPECHRHYEARRLAGEHGAGFDVLYEEPVAEDDPLLALDNFVVTSRLAGGSRLNGLDDMREMITSIHTLLTAHAGGDGGLG